MRAAHGLLEHGAMPTVAEVAKEALVSRATAYRYFPSQEHLLLDVVLERSIDEIDRSVRSAASSGDATARIDGLVSAVHDEILANEGRFRGLLRLSVTQASSDEPTVATIRGERRLAWIAEAVDPIAGELDPDTYRRLTGAIALCVGTEALVVLGDLCGLSPEQSKDTLTWAALALLAAALGEAPVSTPSASND